MRDEITGFEGIALARIEALYEATQYRVHPRQLDDQGNVRGSWWIEADRLVVIEAHAVVGFKEIVGQVRV
ncbi:MAG TPA: hypothetical protein VKB47_08655 [Terracidiphilus sp.]|nr:hypothetical protein [Terracidiphilus sp.]